MLRHWAVGQVFSVTGFQNTFQTVRRSGDRSAIWVWLQLQFTAQRAAMEEAMACEAVGWPPSFVSGKALAAGFIESTLARKDRRLASCPSRLSACYWQKRPTYLILSGVRRAKQCDRNFNEKHCAWIRDPTSAD